MPDTTCSSKEGNCGRQASPKAWYWVRVSGGNADNVEEGEDVEDVEDVEEGASENDARLSATTSIATRYTDSTASRSVEVWMYPKSCPIVGWASA